MSSPVAHECFSGKALVGSAGKCAGVLPIPSPALLGSVSVPVTLAVPKQLLLSSQPVTLGRKITIDMERLSRIS